ncbi:hypothetical protein BDM02DRAFT_3135554 [Thelephora ganbajun]|uniref:Uncharacterized protein n=1 Tax=Thelephora ganbajun TaxID=370292 RepID=A0ACB6ZUU8_THEGA|nr:hypothetical protein BDM02DRAFT_3135554 [Thelephora ganbajun]
MHLPFTPNHVQLISDCYPSQPSISNPVPNSQELSRLLYYASNKPGKVSKLAAELDKRAKQEARKAQAGNVRARATLLITLSIYKYLVNECRRDISQLSAALISSVNTALGALPSDLELAAKAASVLTAWLVYTDGHVINVEQTVSKEYMSILDAFSAMSTVESKSDDHEIRNRTRLVGLAVLNGVVSSEALFSCRTHFKDQVTTIVTALMVTIFQVDIPELENAVTSLRDPSASITYVSRSRPVNERRAVSVHLHKDGENGPSLSDVASSALSIFRTMMTQSNGAQIGLIMQAMFNSLDKTNNWRKTDHCRWLAQAGAEWAQYQHRYAVPTRLVERLLETPDSTSQPMHTALTSMVITVFTSPTPLVNISTSDVVSNLINLVLRRTAVNPDDPLLPALVESISSLGTHVYYADQIQDLAGELISRLVTIESRSKPGVSNKGRAQAIRSLLAGLLGLVQAADVQSAKHTGEIDGSKMPGISTALLNQKDEAEHGHKRVHPSRRTKINPEIWQDTLTLLCEGEYAVRADYARTLVSYIEFEIPRKGDHTGPDGIKRGASIAEGPAKQAKTAAAIMYGDSVTRFLNALHAYVYALATTASLGIGTAEHNIHVVPAQDAEINVVPPTPVESSHNLAAADYTEKSRKEGEKKEENQPETNGDGNEKAEENNKDSPSHSEPQSKRSTLAGTRGFRHVSGMQRLLDWFPAGAQSEKSASATLSDYGHVLNILVTVHEHLPVRALLTSVPMLLALDEASKRCREREPQRYNALQEVLTRVWLTLGRTWDCAPILEEAEKALADLPSPSNLLRRVTSRPGVLFPPQTAQEFEEGVECAPCRGINSAEWLAALVASSNVQEVMGLDSSALQARLSGKWTAESALKDSLEVQASPNAFRNQSLLRVTPTLMNIDNISLQSLGKFNRGVGVTDLRDALEGRSSMSNPALAALRPASVNTVERSTSSNHGSIHHALSVRSGGARRAVSATTKQKKVPGAPREVKDALDRLGIGRPKLNGSTLKTSKSALSKSESPIPVSPPRL